MAKKMLEPLCVLFSDDITCSYWHEARSHCCPLVPSVQHYNHLVASVFCNVNNSILRYTQLLYFVVPSQYSCHFVSRSGLFFQQFVICFYNTQQHHALQCDDLSPFIRAHILTYSYPCWSGFQDVSSMLSAYTVEFIDF